MFESDLVFQIYINLICFLHDIAQIIIKFIFDLINMLIVCSLVLMANRIIQGAFQKLGIETRNKRGSNNSDIRLHITAEP